MFVTQNIYQLVIEDEDDIITYNFLTKDTLKELDEYIGLSGIGTSIGAILQENNQTFNMLGEKLANCELNTNIKVGNFNIVLTKIKLYGDIVNRIDNPCIVVIYSNDDNIFLKLHFRCKKDIIHLNRVCSIDTSQIIDKLIYKKLYTYIKHNDYTFVVGAMGIFS